MQENAVNIKTITKTNTIGCVGTQTIELSRNKQTVSPACVIVYKCPVICCQSQVRIERFNKEVSIQIITQKVNFALSLTYLDKNDYMIIQNDIVKLGYLFKATVIAVLKVK